MEAAMTSNEDVIICCYYDGCSEGDLDELRATLHPDLVHYFPARTPPRWPGPSTWPGTGARC